jgi:adenosylmethionine-8-amino-7-oxononanoate aminotransferase
MERESLPERALALESEVSAAVAPLADHALVSEVRSGLGVLAAVQIDPELVAADPGLPDRLLLGARGHGVLTRVLLGGALQVSPALTITRSELDEVAAGIGAALDDAERA